MRNRIAYDNGFGRVLFDMAYYFAMAFLPFVIVRFAALGYRLAGRAVTFRDTEYFTYFLFYGCCLSLCTQVGGVYVINPGIRRVIELVVCQVVEVFRSFRL